jgi:hypothetical protein
MKARSGPELRLVVNVDEGADGLLAAVYDGDMKWSVAHYPMELL